MRAVVLVGGEGTRLRPLTYTTPKQLLPVCEVPLLERVLVHLAAAGVDEAILSLGYRPDAFVAAYPDGVVAGVRLSYAVEPEPLDTAGAIRFSARHAGVDETFVAVNGDVLTDVDVTSLVDCHRRHDALATLHLTAVDDPSRFGVVSTDGDGRVLAFVEKPPPGTAPSNLINAGTYILEPEVLDQIPDGRPVSIEREIFPDLAAGGRVYAVASDAYWLDAGTPGAYLRAHADLLDGTRGGVPSPGASLLAEGVWVLGRPTVDGDVRPFSLIGDGAMIEAGAAVTSSVVGAGSVIGKGALVEGSVLLPGVHVDGGASVTGSILGRNAVVAEGCVVSALTVVGDDEVLGRGVHLSEARVPA
ncbi:MAG TPA: NDP-sugar synthase [Acidimicrobiales bacterium]|nr:NDP-sugar synthase [Acidimicrobiales bacterium]